MEKISNKRRNSILAAALSAYALSGCSATIDSYLNDASNVHCDGKRTKADLAGNGMATFIVHGEQKGEVATIKVRRRDEAASVSVSGDVSGPPQELGSDGFTAPTPIVEGAELSTFGAGGAWVMDVREESVVIQGSCEGM